ncbi:MAG TPA: hypothetical protein VF581_10100 [Flavobacterium sp.]
MKHLCSSLDHFQKIKDKFEGQVEGVVTDRRPENIILNASGFTLEKCISHLSREYRRLAFAYFSRFPIENFYTVIDQDQLLEEEHSIHLNNQILDALNLKIVQQNGGILFTLPVCAELRNNHLRIFTKNKVVSEVANQYGENENTNFISKLLQNELIAKADGFEKLLEVVGKCSYPAKFKTEFNSLSSQCQGFLIKEIKYAMDRGAKTPFYPDDKLIKNVTPAKEKEIKVFELRIYSPVATRLYFYETTEMLYFASIEGKPKKNVQTTHINNAVSAIKELIIVG